MVAQVILALDSETFAGFAMMVVFFSSVSNVVEISLVVPETDAVLLPIFL